MSRLLRNLQKFAILQKYIECIGKKLYIEYRKVRKTTKKDSVMPLNGGKLLPGNIDKKQMRGIAKRCIVNYATGKPIVVSCELTLSCMAKCRHCDTGGFRANEKQITADKYRELIGELKPAFLQLSGGEPLLRRDIPDIARAVKNGGILPFTILVTNGYLLNEKIYSELRAAGVDRFSVSLDFPNEMHDSFRRLPGLFSKLNTIIPTLGSFGNRDIAMNCAITRSNLPYLREIAFLCEEWGVDVSYSAYSMLRTGDPSHFISSPEDIDLLRTTINELMLLKKERGIVLNPNSTLRNIVKFFETGGVSKCGAGRKFLVIRPEGVLNACSMHRERRYHTREQLISDFTKNNDCTGCYVAIRAYPDKSVISLGKDILEHVMTNIRRSKKSYSEVADIQEA